MSLYTRIKFCGITSEEDCWNASRAGADAIGLVFHQSSPRSLTVQQARIILENRPPFMTCVGLFLNEDTLYVENVLKTVRLDMLQFHGTESAEYCASFGLPYIKAVSMKAPTDLTWFEERYRTAVGLLMDSHVPGEQGGRGETFDWTSTGANCRKPLILAGGLNPDNVVQAITAMSPYAVDVSSGIEVSKGRKDVAKMKAFVKAVRSIE